MKAIDVHVHVTPLFGYRKTMGDEIADALQSYYGVKDVIKTEDEMAEDFNSLDLKALIIAWDAESNLGIPKIDNDYVAGLTKKYPHLYVRAFFIMGMPEDTLETLNETYEMIRETDADRIYLSNVVPFPGTDVFEQAVRDNLLVDLDPDTLYESEDLYLTNYDRIFIKPYNLELEDLREFRARCDELIDM